MSGFEVMTESGVERSPFSDWFRFVLVQFYLNRPPFRNACLVRFGWN